MQRASVLTEHAGFVPYEKRFLETVERLGISTLGIWNLKLSQRVLVHEQAVWDYLQQLCKSHLQLIPLGVDTRIFRPIPLRERENLRRKLGWDERPKILFVGNYVLRKRITLLLQASDPTFDIVLCGEGYPPISHPHLLVYPPLGHQDLTQLYQAADIFVVPSSVETFCIVAYEAMACGLPVIMTTDLAHLTIAQSDLVSLVEPAPDSLRKAILELLRDREKRLYIGHVSAEWVRIHFSWERCVERHLELYGVLLASRERTSGVS